MSTCALILAAGLSRRLGRPKQDILLHGETLLHRAIRVAKEATLDPVITVVGESHRIEALRPFGVTAILNDRAADGMASSIRAGITWAQRQKLTGIILMTCDQPAVTTGHLQALCALPHQITGSRYAGRIGVPAYFPAAAFRNLLHLQGDAGARSLLRDAPALQNESLALDIDTEDDLREAECRILHNMF